MLAHFVGELRPVEQGDEPKGHVLRRGAWQALSHTAHGEAHRRVAQREREAEAALWGGGSQQFEVHPRGVRIGVAEGLLHVDILAEACCDGPNESVIETGTTGHEKERCGRDKAYEA